MNNRPEILSYLARWIAVGVRRFHMEANQTDLP